MLLLEEEAGEEADMGEDGESGMFVLLFGVEISGEEVLVPLVKVGMSWLLLLRLSLFSFTAVEVATNSDFSSSTSIVAVVASSSSGKVKVVDETITSSSFTVTRWSDNILETMADRLALVIASDEW